MLLTSIKRYMPVTRGAIHVGAHDGEERDWYVENGFTQVIWFEPNKFLFARLQANIRDYKNNVAYNVGVHDTLGEARLNISNNDGQSSSILPLGTHARYYPDVKYTGSEVINLIRLDAIFDKDTIKNYNFLNIDVQGVELNVIRSLGILINSLDYIYTEVNEEELYRGCSLLPEIDSYLKQYSFFRIATKMMKSHWGDALYKRYA